MNSLQTSAAKPVKHKISTGKDSEKTESSAQVEMIPTVSALTAPVTKTTMTIRITPTMMTRALSATIMKMDLRTQLAQSWAREPFRTQWESQYLLLPP